MPIAQPLMPICVQSKVALAELHGTMPATAAQALRIDVQSKAPRTGRSLLGSQLALNTQPALDSQLALSTYPRSV